MSYQFPIIEHLNDVLPAIEGRDEFFVGEREGFKVVNYRVAFADTFEIDENDLMENHGNMIPRGIMQRELRGLIFDVEGNLLSRPFHKFFNVGERKETRACNIDLSKPHVITEKMDGSMIRPLNIGGKVRLATKMGFSDVAEAAQQIVTEAQLRWMGDAIDRGITPLFEFISPDNRVVVEYDNSELVLLALRENRTGKYLDMDEWRQTSLFRVVPQFGSVDGTLKEYIARQRATRGREGDVLAVGDMRYKIKNDWYVQAHKMKDNIRRSDREILLLLLNNALDDVLPIMADREFDRVRKYETDFHQAFKGKLDSLQRGIDAVIREADGDRKELARRILPKAGFSKIESRFVFGVLEGRDLNDMLMEHVHSSLTSHSRYKKVAEFLGL
eukprot:CAMPEP_0117031440 /NCGR_PEP_ID=MMETSP0472-20121206/22595_1 /TAXON_ID=693140 ORGANISM="Tiarina fusus, Strain LIS" /NCGR_SAMPLE_ID=MMETSP0472 /ASSEMBLY_ACC=CAM_ASM_000603 /LENGTH=386 /DNA_ID=CAMNT_0004739761 /DNA_START=48 /DNA_END=1208 /DNA_ORIENTATION=-